MFYDREYMISVEFDAQSSVADLRNALQQACDEGAEFQFQILSTRGSTYLVLVFRDASADDDYIAARMRVNGEEECKRAALLQLANEIDEIGHPLLDVMVSKMKTGDATVLSYGSLDNIKPQPRFRFLDGPTVIDVMHDLPSGRKVGLYMDIARPLSLPLASIMDEVHGIVRDHGFDPNGDRLIGDWAPHETDSVTNVFWFFQRYGGTEA